MMDYIATPTVAMRAAPRQDAEVLSQALFSEEVQTIDETQDWLQIETLCDGYRGWIERNARCTANIAYPSPESQVATVSRNAAHLYTVEDTIYGPMMTLPFGSRLQVLDPTSDDSRWLQVLLPNQLTACIQRGDVKLSNHLLNWQEMCALSHQFLGLPYTWGGRSSFGYDCSGFVQMLYRQMGVFLPRDARDQIHWPGFTEREQQQAQPGDLIFFGPEATRIQHVGMVLDSERFIHATVAENAPYLRISNLHDPYWNGTGRYSYRTMKYAMAPSCFS